ncbi:MAG TPA: hypothetical protein VIV12_18040 [Streptosporangiaceae bacterium]
MLRRLIVLTALAGGVSFASAITLAGPALAKGPTQARITGPGLDHAIVVSGAGEPGEMGSLAVLAGETNLFTVLFGPDAGLPPSARLHSAPPKDSLGPRYLVVYTIPGVEPQPGEEFGQVRQVLYPAAAGGPVVYTPPGQRGFGQALQEAGWLQAPARLTHTLAKLGVPLKSGAKAVQQTRRTLATPAAAAQPAGPGTPGWPVAFAVAMGVAALAGGALWLRRRKPAPPREGKPGPAGSAG